jgi:hypothetical protein
MNRNTSRIVLAVGLIVIGLLALVNSLGIVQLPWANRPNLAWLLIFGLAGLAMLVTFFTGSDNRWAIIPALTFIGLAILVGDVLPERLASYGVALFKGPLASSFWVIYLVGHDNWWAIIPGGVLLSVAALIWIGQSVRQGPVAVAIFFLGMAATFLLLYILPKPIGRVVWPLYPAGAMALLGVLFLFNAGLNVQWLWGAGLLLLGAWIIWRSMRR